MPYFDDPNDRDSVRGHEFKPSLLIEVALLAIALVAIVLWMRSSHQ